jgi:hypothetical protein
LFQNFPIAAAGIWEQHQGYWNPLMNASTPPPLITPPQNTGSFSHQAAKASWVTAVLVFVLSAFGGQAGGARVLIELIALLLMVIGFILGIVALLGIRKHGVKGILAPALIGLIINGLLIFIFISNFLAARARAR